MAFLQKWGFSIITVVVGVLCLLGGMKVLGGFALGMSVLSFWSSLSAK
jgi:hypothetical protein